MFAGLTGFLGLIIGAIAAHQAHTPQAAALLQEASLYALIHSALLIAVSQRNNNVSCLSCFLLAVGMLLFCGGITLRALAPIHFSLWLIPVGGGCLMFGWLAAGIGCFISPMNKN